METRFVQDKTDTETVPRCAVCPLNTYQNQVGGEECIPCPDNHITNSSGAKFVKDCIGINNQVIYP